MCPLWADCCPDWRVWGSLLVVTSWPDPRCQPAQLRSGGALGAHMAHCVPGLRAHRGPGTGSASSGGSVDPLAVPTGA